MMRQELRYCRWLMLGLALAMGGVWVRAAQPIVYPNASSGYARLIRGGEGATNYVGISVSYGSFDLGPVGWTATVAMPGTGIGVTVEPSSGSFSKTEPGPVLKIISRADALAPKGSSQGIITFTTSGYQDPAGYYTDTAEYLMVVEVAADNAVHIHGGGSGSTYLECEKGQTASKTVTLINDGPDRLYQWKATPNVPWLSVGPSSGDFIPSFDEGGYAGRERSLLVSADAAVLAPGSYQGKVIVTAANLRTASYEHAVNLTVKPSTGLEVGRLDQKWLARGTDLALLIHGQNIAVPVTLEFLKGDGTVDSAITFSSVAVNGTDRISAVCSVGAESALGVRGLRVRSGGREVILADAAHVVGFGLEVNQGAKTAPTAPRAANHPTVVRAFVESAGPAGFMKGLLYVFNGENQVFGSQFRPGTLEPSTDSSGSPLLEPVLRVDPPYTAEERFYLRDSLNFYFECDGQNSWVLPPPLSVGRREFWLAVSAENPASFPTELGTLTRSQLLARKDCLWYRAYPVQEFVALRPYRVLVWIDNRLAPGAVQRIANQLATTQRFLNAAFPGRVSLHVRDDISKAALDVDALKPSGWNPVGEWWANVHAYLARQLAVWNRDRTGAGRFDQIVLATDGTGVQAICGLGTLGMADKSSAAIVGDYPTTFAHEITHNFGLGDTYCGYECGNPLNLVAPCYTVAANCRRSDALAGGNRVEEGAVRLVPVYSRGRDPVVGATACVGQPGGPVAPRPGFSLAYRRVDLMGTADDENSRWPDLIEWNQLFDAMLPKAGLAQGDGTQIVARGVIGTNRQVDMVRFAREPLPVRTSAAPDPAGEYSLVQLDAGGAVQGSDRFTLDFRVPGVGPVPAVSFAMSAAWQSGTAHVELRHQGVTLLRQALSPRAPTVTVLEPSGGLIDGGVVPIRWEASDPDGDPLTFAVFCIRDDGTPVPLACDLEGATFSWVSAGAAGCAQGRIAVIASDGFNEGRAESAPFSLPRQPPRVAWVSPAPGTAVSWGMPIMLSGVGWDPEDGLLEPVALSFRSSLDGALGTGTVVAAWLSMGQHTLTLEGRDADGNTAQSTLEVTVGEAGVIPLLQGIEPGAGMAGTTVELTGLNFEPGATAVRFDDLVAEVIEVASTRCTARVPLALAPGITDVSVAVGTLVSQPVSFRVEAPPALQALAVTGGIELRWPEAYAGFTLEVSDAVGWAAVWKPVGETPGVVDEHWRVVVPAHQASRFFRLVSSP